MIAETQSPNERLILVDNEVDVLESLRALLKQHGFNPVAFASSTEALENIDANDVGVVVTDLDMPGLSGIDLLNALIERKCAISVVVISGIADVPLTVEVMSKGAITLLQKPFSSEKLIEAIRRATEVSRARKEKFDKIMEARERIQRLTAEELSIMVEASKGIPYKAISYDTGVSTRTVDRRVQSSLSKLGIQSLAEFAVLYVFSQQEL